MHVNNIQSECQQLGQELPNLSNHCLCSIDQIFQFSKTHSKYLTDELYKHER